MFSEGDNQNDPQIVGNPIDGLYQQAIEEANALIEAMGWAMTTPENTVVVGRVFQDRVRFNMTAMVQLLEKLREENKTIRDEADKLVRSLGLVPEEPVSPAPHANNHKKERFGS